MRIGNNIDGPQSDNKQVVVNTTNYAKAANTHAIRLDITDIGKDTGFIIDQGRSIQDVISEAGVLDVKTRQDYMTVMSNTMSKEDYAKMCKEGFNPSQMSDAESVTIMDHIKAVMAQSGDVVTGFNDDLDIDKLKQITGNETNAHVLLNAIKEADIVQNLENAKKINATANEIQNINELKESGMVYMLENNLSPTMDNIYLANYSVGGAEKTQGRGYYSLGMQGYLAQKGEASDISSLINDIEKTVSDFRIDDIDYDTQIDEAKWLIEKGLDVTERNIEKLNELRDIKLPLSYEEAVKKAAFTLAKGEEPKKADLTRHQDDIYTKAAEIKEKVDGITDNQIKNVIESAKRINLNNIWSAPNTEVYLSDTTLYQQSRAQLEEIRLRMTLDANVLMLKRGMSIDTMPLSNLVDNLKVSQQIVNESMFGEVETETKASLYNSTRDLVSSIPYMPAAVIGRLKLEEEYSLTTIHEAGTELKAKYEAANESYETLMTAPRRDMGDSITKAFRNVDAILKDIGLDINEDNAKAVRILGYNSMEINPSEVNRIKGAYLKVKQVVDKLTPARTLQLIRDGINPLEMSLDKLTDRLSVMDVEESAEKYSRFLYKLQKSNEINASEREAFIGIYRLMNRLEKTDGAAIGALVNENRDITLKSLLSGMRSRGVSFNESIDDNYGFLQNVISKGTSISDQIEQAFTNQLGQAREEELNNEFIEDSYKEYMDTINNNQNAVEGLRADAQPVTVENMLAYNTLNDKERNVFKQIKELAKKTQQTNEDYDNKVNSLIDSFETSKGAKAGYESFIQSGMNTLDEYLYQVDSNLDVNQIRLCHKQLSLAFSRSNQNKYTVPVEINGELTAINLTFRHGSDSNVRASFVSDEYGQITAHFSINDNKVEGMIVSESREGIDYFNKIVDRMNRKSELNMNIRVIVGKENLIINDENGKISDSDADNNNVNTESLYKLAKSFLKEYSQGA